MSENKETKKSWKQYTSRAKDLLGDKAQVLEAVQQAYDKVDKNKGLLGTVRDDFMTLFRLLKSWVSGSYRSIPIKSIVLATAAILYFLNPLDLIPDISPFIGFIDDISIVGWVLQSIRQDLQDYSEWEAEKSVS